jgi:hypothetical protein
VTAARVNATGSAWREHVAGPMIQDAMLCSRCGEVLWVRPPDRHGSRSRPWSEGRRIASDGETAKQVDGWPYTWCLPWQPKRGDRPVGHADLAAALADPAAAGFLAGASPKFTGHLARLLMSLLRRP